METFQIYTVSGGDILFKTFHAIASLLRPGGGTLVGALVALGSVIGVTSAMWYTVFRNNVQPITSWLISYNLIMLVLISPVGRIQIKDSMTNHTHFVDNVPYGLAFTAGMISTMAHGITEVIEAAFQPSPPYQGGAGLTNAPPAALAYSKTGMIFGAIAMQQAKVIKFTNDDINENMKEFVGQCVTYDVMLGRKYTLHDLRHSNDIWKLISEKASKMRSFPWRNITRGDKNIFVSSEGTEIITCKEGVGRFNNLMAQATTHALSDVTRKVLGALGIKDNGQAIGQGVGGHLPGALMYLTKKADNASDLIKQQMMISGMVMGSQANAAEFGASVNPEVARAYLQQRSTYWTTGQVIAQSLPAVKNLLEALCYALFIFVVALCLLPNGFKIFGYYAKILIWIQLWSPLFAILNFLSTEAMAWGIQSALKDEGGLTIANIVGVDNMAQDIAGAAGYLCGMITILSWSLLQKGGGYAFSSMASSIMGVSQNAAASASQEAVTGNYNYGNVGLNGFQNENKSVFQQQMASRYTSPGHFQMEDGLSSKTTTASGDVLLNQSISQLPVSIRASESQEQAASQLYNEALSVSESESKAAERSQQMTAANYLEIGKQASHQISNGTQWSDQETANRMQEAANYYDKALTIGKKYGLDEQAVNLLSGSIGGAAGINGGIDARGESNRIGIAANLDAHIKNENISQASINSARDELLNLSKSENFRSAESQMEQFAVNKNHDVLDQNTKQAVENFSGSYQNSLQHSERAQKATDASKSLSNELRSAQTNAKSLDGNYTQDFVNHVGADKLSHMSTAEQMQAARSYQSNIGNVYEKQLRSKHDLKKEYTDSTIDQSFGSVQSERARVNAGITAQTKAAGVELDSDIRPQGFIMKQTLMYNNENDLVKKQAGFQSKIANAKSDFADQEHQ